MRPYQLQGLNWMVFLHHNGLNGILADEMVHPDLMYTPFMTYGLHAGPRKNPAVYLLPCLPQTLSRHLWPFSCRRPEIHSTKLVSRIQPMDSWFQSCFVGGYQGRTSGNHCQSTYIPGLRGLRLIEKTVLKKFSFEYILIDEAHHIKNVDSILSQIVCTFTSRGRLLITGTPLQNSLKELFSLLNFICPEIFVDYKDLDSFLHKNSTGTKDEDAKSKKVVEALHKILWLFLLRRVKSDVEKGLLPSTCKSCDQF